MAFRQHIVTLQSTEPLQILDVTKAAEEFVAASEIQNGLLIVASLHTTMGVVVNEECGHLEKDITRFLEKLVPAEGDYEHNRYAVDGRPNAHSHLLSLLIPSQVTIVIVDGMLQLGAWQSIFALELDGPRSSRKIHMTAISA